MTGVDLSQEMLWLAGQKARKAGLGIPFVMQDMRKLHLHLVHLQETWLLAKR